MQTMGNRGNLLATKATLWPISPGNHQQPPATTRQLVSEGAFFPSDRKLPESYQSVFKHARIRWLAEYLIEIKPTFFFVFQSSEVEHDGRGLGTRPEQLASEWRNMVWALENNSKAFKNSTCYKYRLFFFFLKKHLSFKMIDYNRLLNSK